MLGTVWLGMARMMICRTGEIGELNRLMPMRRRAVAMVMAAVTGEVERASEAVASDGLW